MKSAQGNQLFWISLGIILLCAVGALDYITGPELAFSLFYLIPITVVSLGFDWKSGILMAIVSGALWFLVDASSGVSYSSPFVHYWNTAIRLCFFLIVVFFIRLSKTLKIEKDMARTDFITGAFNARHFHELAQAELERSARYNHSLTLAFLDADNFKTINDLFGHAVGDQALHTIASNLRKGLRGTDIIARVGGDEFVILMPETGGDAVKRVMTKLQSSLLDEMKRHGWPITLSIGVLTFNAMPKTADEMLNMADQVMYTVKNSGKDNIRYAIYPELEMPQSKTDHTDLPYPK